MEENVKSAKTKPSFTFDEVRKHNKKEDKWLVIDGQAYNITSWAGRHPGGSRVISHYAGQDASDVFRAFHPDLVKVRKYLKPIHLGAVEDVKTLSIDEDFRQLRQTAEKMGLFKPSYMYYILMMCHILALELLSYLILYYYGVGWVPFIGSLLVHVIFQQQAGYLSHDFGHLSVFHSSTWDHALHYFIFGIEKGASPIWWNHMHHQHHAKPNVMDKDPDVRVDKIFVIGEVMPVEVAKSRKQITLPFNKQHKYFCIIGPPLLFPVYFFVTCLRHVYTRKLWLDGAIILFYFVKFFCIMVPFVGWGWAIFYYEAYRVLESTWFTWVTQSNHIPMNIDHDDAKPWLSLQSTATCDIEKSHFNDWFTGHLNFQIEHHLFPMIPRHNLYRIRPLVQSLCKKHGIPFQVKPLMTGFVDVIRSLKHSGEIWNAAYHAHHLI